MKRLRTVQNGEVARCACQVPGHYYLFDIKTTKFLSITAELLEYLHDSLKLRRNDGESS